MLNAQFFAALRSGLYNKGLSQDAVNGMNTLCAAFDGFTGHDHCTDDLAAVLATCYLETGHDFDLGIIEIGRGRGKAYGIATGPYKQTYYGRGACQLTWLANYTRFTKRLNVDLVQFPDKACDPKTSCTIILDGMYGGLFTGRGLRNYITPGRMTTQDAFREARRIINGQDKAAWYAELCVSFQRALVVGYDKPTTLVAVNVNKPTVSPSTPQQPLQRRGLFADIAAWFRGKGQTS